MRTCVGCRQVKNKADLIRLVVVGGRVVADPAARASGRGAYLCPDPDCWLRGERRRALDRALRVTLAADDWPRLREGILD